MYHPLVSILVVSYVRFLLNNTNSIFNIQDIWESNVSYQRPYFSDKCEEKTINHFVRNILFMSRFPGNHLIDRIIRAIKTRNGCFVWIFRHISTHEKCLYNFLSSARSVISVLHSLKIVLEGFDCENCCHI